MEEENAIPTRLKVVAWILIVLGALAGVQTVLGFVAGNVHINLVIVAIFFGIGILRLENWWRKIAVALCVVSMFAAAVSFVLLPLIGTDLDVVLFGIGSRSTFSSPGMVALGMGVAAIFTVLFFWMTQTLREKEIVSLFEDKQKPEQ
ncbi:MAG: hypothetical protein JXA28_14070, partial [Bacteroidetes bacterium]|nr:hypothetical protein [Bacteroidota bacterium]